MTLTFSFWAILLGRLAIEAGLLVAVAVGVQRILKSPVMHRATWQAVILGVGLTWVCEVGGARRWVTEISNAGQTEQPLTAQVDFGVESAVPNDDVQRFTGINSMERTEPISPGREFWWPLWIWGLGGALVGLKAISTRIWLGVASARLCRPVVDHALLSTVENLCQRFCVRNVRMVIWPGIHTPIAFGSLRPTIAIPEGFTERFSQGEQETILAHELAHLASGDPFWSGVADLVLAIAWWHPAVWWSRHQFREACESAADEASALVPGGRVFLAELLVKLGRDLVAPGIPHGLGIGGGMRSRLAKRVTGLLSESREWRRERPATRWITRSCAPALAGLLVAVPGPGTSGPALFSILVTSPLSATTTREAGAVARDAEVKGEESPKTSSRGETDEANGRRDVSSRADEVLLKLTNGAMPGSTFSRTKLEPTTGRPNEVGADESLLLTREYQLNGDKFRRHLQRFIPEAGTNLIDTDVKVALRRFAASLGVAFPAPITNSSGGLDVGANSPAAISFNARTGQLFVRATEADLGRIDREIGLLVSSWKTRMVVLDVKILEVTESGGGGMDLDWFFDGESTNHPNDPLSRSREALKDSNLPTGPNTRIDQIQSTGQSAELTPIQFSALLKRMQDREGTDVLSVPKVVTLSGRPAKISVMEDRNIVTGIDTNRNGLSYTTQVCKVGPSVMLVPELEGNEVKLSLSATFTEFLGYDAPKSGVDLQFTTPDGRTLSGQQSFPHFRVRSQEVNVIGKLRNTIALYGPVVTNVVQFKSKVPVLGDIPLVGGLFRSGGTSQILKRLYLFVTPTEVDGAGQAM